MNEKTKKEIIGWFMDASCRHGFDLGNVTRKEHLNVIKDFLNSVDIEQFIENKTLKYRKKPIVVSAEQFFYPKQIDGVKYTNEGAAFIQTLEGRMWVQDGDWIITGIKGEKYPCKADVFEETYEKV